MAKTIDEGSATDRARSRIRELRGERALTLEAVAARTGIGVSTLSRLESGERRLSVEHLALIADALGVGASELLAPPSGRDDPRVRGRSRTRWGLTMWPLTRHGPAGGLHAFKIRIDPERRTPPAELPVHEGHDWMYVLSGRMRLVLGEQDMVIEPGEAVEFSTWTPHWFGTAGGPVEIIAIFGPNGERVHLQG